MRLTHCTLIGALAIAGTAFSCQPTPSTSAATATPTTAPSAAVGAGEPAVTPPAPAGAPTEAAARAAVGRYLQGQSNANLYVLDSARAIDLGAGWQVLVPRTDWARRMPNRAAFEVDKQTGDVKTLMVK